MSDKTRRAVMRAARAWQQSWRKGSTAKQIDKTEARLLEACDAHFPKRKRK
jgi:hypothetical protein